MFNHKSEKYSKKYSNLSMKERSSLAVEDNDLDAISFFLPVSLAIAISHFNADEVVTALNIILEYDQVNFSLLIFEQTRLIAVENHAKEVVKLILQLIFSETSKVTNLEQLDRCLLLMKQMFDQIPTLGKKEFALIREQQIEPTNDLSENEQAIFSRSDFWIPFRSDRHYSAVRDIISLEEGKEVALQGNIEPYCPLVESNFVSFTTKKDSLIEFRLFIQEIFYFPYNERLRSFPDEPGTKLINRESDIVKKIRLVNPAEVLFKTSPKDVINLHGYTMGIIISCPDIPELEGVVVSPPIVQGRIFSGEEEYPYGDGMAQQKLGIPSILLVRKSRYSQSKLKEIVAQIRTKLN